MQQNWWHNKDKDKPSIDEQLTYTHGTNFLFGRCFGSFLFSIGSSRTMTITIVRKDVIAQIQIPHRKRHNGRILDFEELIGLKAIQVENEIGWQLSNLIASSLRRTGPRRRASAPGFCACPLTAPSPSR